MSQSLISQLDIQFFSSAEEGHFFNRKSSRKNIAEISRHIAAFANAAGGKLVIGIEDDGAVTSFKQWSRNHKKLAKTSGKTERTAGTTLKSLTAKGVFEWHGTSRRDPSQFYTLANDFGVNGDTARLMLKYHPINKEKKDSEPCRLLRSNS